jgi:hypothetical protein
VRCDASYRTVSTGGAEVLIGTNCIGNKANCSASSATVCRPLGRTALPDGLSRGFRL